MPRTTGGTDERRRSGPTGHGGALRVRFRAPGARTLPAVFAVGLGVAAGNERGGATIGSSP